MVAIRPRLPAHVSATFSPWVIRESILHWAKEFALPEALYCHELAVDRSGGDAVFAVAHDRFELFLDHQGDVADRRKRFTEA